MVTTEYIDKGIDILKGGITTIRTFLLKLLTYLPWDEKTSLYVLFFAISLYLSYLWVKQFTTSPFSAKYIFYMLIEAILIFLIIMYI